VFPLRMDDIETRTPILSSDGSGTEAGVRQADTQDHTDLTWALMTPRMTKGMHVDMGVTNLNFKLLQGVRIVPSSVSANKRNIDGPPARMR
jgi:hypothetical protein